VRPGWVSAQSSADGLEVLHAQQVGHSQESPGKMRIFMAKNHGKCMVIEQQIWKINEHHHFLMAKSTINDLLSGNLVQFAIEHDPFNIIYH
jgi:hypothetical protein